MAIDIVYRFAGDGKKKQSLRTLAITWPQRAFGVLYNPAVAAQVDWIVVQPGLVSWHYTAHDSCTFAYC